MLPLKLSILISVYVVVASTDQNISPLVLGIDNDVEQISNVNFRLPNFTYPNSYDIALSTRIDQSKFEFIGRVKIGIVVDYTTREIVLHARQLNISSIRLSRYSGTVPIDIRLLPHSYDVYTEFLRISTDGPILISGDRLLLEISYVGTLRSDNAGFYRTSYVNANGDRM